MLLAPREEGGRTEGGLEASVQAAPRMAQRSAGGGGGKAGERAPVLELSRPDGGAHTMFSRQQGGVDSPWPEKRRISPKGTFGSCLGRLVKVPALR